MSVSLEQAIELQAKARTFRKKGDALRKNGREEQAVEAYASGLASLNAARDLLNERFQMLRSSGPPAPEDTARDLHELIEIHGSLGGIYQRLGALDESLASYSEGATLEEDFQVTSTYNRLNEIKTSLLTGSENLKSVENRIQALATFIDANLRDDQSLSDRGWAWADLGDCLALLGRTKEAVRAYTTFIAKAEIKSPERTLDVLKEINSKLEANGDPDASRLSDAVDELTKQITMR